MDSFESTGKTTPFGPRPEPVSSRSISCLLPVLKPNNTIIGRSELSKNDTKFRSEADKAAYLYQSRCHCNSWLFVRTNRYMSHSEAFQGF